MMEVHTGYLGHLSGYLGHLNVTACEQSQVLEISSFMALWSNNSVLCDVSGAGIFMKQYSYLCPFPACSSKITEENLYCIRKKHLWISGNR